MLIYNHSWKWSSIFLLMFAAKCLTKFFGGKIQSVSRVEHLFLLFLIYILISIKFIFWPLSMSFFSFYRFIPVFLGLHLLVLLLPPAAPTSSERHRFLLGWNMAYKCDVANWLTGRALLTSTKASLCDLLFKHVGEAAACIQFGQPSVDELQP